MPENYIFDLLWSNIARTRPTNDECEFDCLHLRNPLFWIAEPVVFRFSDIDELLRMTRYVTGTTEQKSTLLRSIWVTHWLWQRSDWSFWFIKRMPRDWFFIVHDSATLDGIIWKWFSAIMPKNSCLIILPRINKLTDVDIRKFIYQRIINQNLSTPA